MPSAQSQRRRDSVHDIPGGVQRLAVPLHWSGRPGRRHADRQPQPAGDRRADRTLRQHAGPADGPVRQSEFSGAPAAGTRDLFGGVRSSGPAV